MSIITTSPLVAIMALSMSAVANPAFLPEDPKRPVDKVGHDLNITPE